jgi:hypothetical protein
VAAVPGEFAFLVHYTEEEDIFRSDPSFRQFDKSELANWGDWVKQFGAGFARRIPRVTSAAGATAGGWIVSVPMLPGEMRGSGRKVAEHMIRDAVDLAGGKGLTRVGLGAFTSIVTRGGGMVTGRGDTGPNDDGGDRYSVAAPSKVSVDASASALFGWSSWSIWLGGP